MTLSTILFHVSNFKNQSEMSSVSNNNNRSGNHKLRGSYHAIVFLLICQAKFYKTIAFTFTSPIVSTSRAIGGSGNSIVTGTSSTSHADHHHPSQRSRTTYLQSTAAPSQRRSNTARRRRQKNEIDPYLILNIDARELASMEEIKKAYRLAAMRYHPDVTTNSESTKEDREKANDDFAKINAAYSMLTGKDVKKNTISSKKKGNTRTETSRTSASGSTSRATTSSGTGFGTSNTKARTSTSAKKQRRSAPSTSSQNKSSQDSVFKNYGGTTNSDEREKKMKTKSPFSRFNSPYVSTSSPAATNHPSRTRKHPEYNNNPHHGYGGTSTDASRKYDDEDNFDDFSRYDISKDPANTSTKRNTKSSVNNKEISKTQKAWKASNFSRHSYGGTTTDQGKPNDSSDSTTGSDPYNDITRPFNSTIPINNKVGGTSSYKKQSPSSATTTGTSRSTTTNPTTTGTSSQSPLFGKSYSSSPKKTQSFSNSDVSRFFMDDVPSANKMKPNTSQRTSQQINKNKYSRVQTMKSSPIGVGGFTTTHDQDKKSAPSSKTESSNSQTSSSKKSYSGNTLKAFLKYAQQHNNKKTTSNHSTQSSCVPNTERTNPYQNSNDKNYVNTVEQSRGVVSDETLFGASPNVVNKLLNNNDIQSSTTDSKDSTSVATKDSSSSDEQKSVNKVISFLDKVIGKGITEVSTTMKKIEEFFPQKERTSKSTVVAGRKEIDVDNVLDEVRDVLSEVEEALKNEVSTAKNETDVICKVIDTTVKEESREVEEVQSVEMKEIPVHDVLDEVVDALDEVEEVLKDVLTKKVSEAFDQPNNADSTIKKEESVFKSAQVKAVQEKVVASALNEVEEEIDTVGTKEVVEKFASLTDISHANKEGRAFNKVTEAKTKENSTKEKMIKDTKYAPGNSIAEIISGIDKTKNSADFLMKTIEKAHQKNNIIVPDKLTEQVIVGVVANSTAVPVIMKESTGARQSNVEEKKSFLNKRSDDILSKIQNPMPENDARRTSSDFAQVSSATNAVYYQNSTIISSVEEVSASVNPHIRQLELAESLKAAAYDEEMKRKARIRANSKDERGHNYYRNQIDNDMARVKKIVAEKKKTKDGVNHISRIDRHVVESDMARVKKIVAEKKKLQKDIHQRSRLDEREVQYKYVDKNDKVEDMTSKSLHDGSSPRPSLCESTSSKTGQLSNQNESPSFSSSRREKIVIAIRNLIKSGMAIKLKNYVSEKKQLWRVIKQSLLEERDLQDDDNDRQMTSKSETPTAINELSSKRKIISVVIQNFSSSLQESKRAIIVSTVLVLFQRIFVLFFRQAAF